MDFHTKSIAFIADFDELDTDGDQEPVLFVRPQLARRFPMQRVNTVVEITCLEAINLAHTLPFTVD